MTPPIPDDVLRERAEAYLLHGRNQVRAALALDISRSALQHSLKQATEKGFLGPAEPPPGFVIKTIAKQATDGSHVRFVKEPGEEFVIPIGQKLKGVSALVDPDGREILKWLKTGPDDAAHNARFRAIIEGLKAEIPRAAEVQPPGHVLDDLLSQYTVTDMHLGALAWNEETGQGDYDLSIGEKLFVDWFAAAIAQAPASKYAVLAQLGDFLHHDGFKSVTPESGHLLDADSRYPKMVRAAIRAVRKVIGMLLAKHERVHIIMSDDNHSPASEVWLREMFAVLYENEPRVTVDTSPGTYLVYEFGDVAIFYHHGHRKKIRGMDSAFVARFREIYGRTRFSYAHRGHNHSDELITTDLMKVEQHETLAAPDAYGANWISGRSAKVINYHRKHGEVGRNTITAAMVMQ